MKRSTACLIFFGLSLVTAVFSRQILSCGPIPVIRAYFTRSFWQPLTLTVFDQLRTKKPARIKEPFAGMAVTASAKPLEKARAAYRALSSASEEPQPPGGFDGARNILKAARQSQLSQDERDELDLIEAKLDLREAESLEGDAPLLAAAREKLQAFLEHPHSPAKASEARGWLARVFYLSGDRVSAAKIYLDELDQKESLHTQESLLLSLSILFPHDGSDARLAENLEKFLDTPEHALFAVTLATNPRVDFPGEPAREPITRAVFAALEKRPGLFEKKGASEKLALALMRAAFFSGDMKRVAAFAQRVSRNSKLRQDPEFLWTLGAAAFLDGHYTQARKHFERLSRSRQAGTRYKILALQGLAGACARLGLPAQQLDAALRHLALEDPGEPVGDTRGRVDFLLFEWRYSLDAIHLLDVTLTASDLNSYLQKDFPSKRLRFNYGMPRGGDWIIRHRSGEELVKYALAVRLAREERYDESAAIYEELKANPREQRMTELASLFKAASAEGASFEARFLYASFIASHSTQIFFNDTLWQASQRYAFFPPGCEESLGPAKVTNAFGEEIDCTETAEDLMTKDEQIATMKKERALRDSQEEYWRAAGLFKALAKDGKTREERTRAARKAIWCLDQINQDRFGRSREIASIQKELIGVLRERKSG